MARALVTGGTGFVGANLARMLLARGHEVHLLLRAGHQGWRLEGVEREVRVHGVDLRDREGVSRACGEIRPELVFHLAAGGAYSWQQDVAEITAVNVNATAYLLEACRGAEAFVHAGSSSEYGYKDHAPGEEERIEPNSVYAATKAAATHLCRAAAVKDGRRVVTLRLYSVYGPFEEPKRLVPTLLVKGMVGEYPPLVAPETARDFVYVGDVCEAFLLAATDGRVDGAGIYNVGSGRQTTVREAVEVVRKVVGIEKEPVWGGMEARRWDTNVWVSDPGLIERTLGWRAETGLEEGLRKTRAWLMESGVLGRYQEEIAGG